MRIAAAKAFPFCTSNSEEEDLSDISKDGDTVIKTETVTEVRESLLNSTIKEVQEGGEWFIQQKGRRRKSLLVLNVSSSDSSGGVNLAKRERNNHSTEVETMASGSTGGGNADQSVYKKKCWALAPQNYPDAKLTIQDYELIHEYLSQNRRSFKVNGAKAMMKIMLDDVVF